MRNNISTFCRNFPKLLLGDWLTLALSMGLVGLLFWQMGPQQAALKLQIRQGNHIVGTYNLNQQLVLNIKGNIGISTIQIDHGKARFLRAPCRNQYCVHQAWLQHVGEIALCLPNQVSITLLGNTPYQSMSY